MNRKQHAKILERMEGENAVAEVLPHLRGLPLRRPQLLDRIAVLESECHTWTALKETAPHDHARQMADRTLRLYRRWLNDYRRALAELAARDQKYWG